MTGATQLVSKSDASLILGQVDRDINAVVNRALAQDPTLADNPQELQRIVSANLDTWYQQQVMSAGGNSWMI